MARRKSAYKLPKFSLKPKAVISVGVLVSCILALLSLASLFTTDYRLGIIRNSLYQTIGWTFVFSPLLFILIAIVLMGKKWRIAQLNVLVGFITVMIAVMALSAGADNAIGGEAGRFIWRELSTLMSGLLAGLTLIIVLAIGLVVMLSLSITELFGAAAKMGEGVSKLPKPKFGSDKPMAIHLDQGPMKISGVDDKAMPKLNLDKRVEQKKESVLPETLITSVAGQARVWKYPALSILSDKSGAPADRGDVKKNAQKIEATLDSFGIQARVAEVNGGPAVTQYALELSSGTKIQKIANLQNDIALSLATRTGTVRIEAPIPGKSLVGIEVPNQTLEVVTLKSIMASSEMAKHKSKLAVCLGKDTGSHPVIVDIDKMPHCLVAGTTGSGKSVMMHSMISSLLFRNSPDELKLILIDPKRVEMSNYNNIPHLLAPVIVDPEKILSALKWACKEMDNRYKLFQSVGVRNIQGYNEMSGFQSLPNIVIFIDELADLMMFAPVEVEDAITRLAQLARATGIHLVVATQRPSVDVITGLMKANIPSRIAFNVASMIDSRVIIDGQGAEKLLGRGDMLFMPPDASKPMRVQGVYIQDAEINGLVKYLREVGIAPQYAAEVTEMPVGKIAKGRGADSGGDIGDRDDLFEDAVRAIAGSDQASATFLQRKLRVGYARAARILDELNEAGLVGPGQGSKPREVQVHNLNAYLQGGSGSEAGAAADQQNNY